MARILTVCNQKGGVGKTTSVINLSACLAEMGRKVLTIDLDPQANCTAGLGVLPGDLTHSVYEVLAQPKKFVIYQIEDVILHTKWPNLDLVPSHINLAGAELELVNKLGREVLLKKALRPVLNLYDFILIDTPPSLSLLTVNALTTVNEVVISMRAEPWSLDGIENLLETIEIVREDLNPEIRLAGVIVTMLEPRTALAKDIISRMEGDERLRDHIFSTKIRRNVRLAQSADAGTPVIHFDSACHGAWAYRRVTRELLVRLGEARPEELADLKESAVEEEAPAKETSRAETPAVAESGATGWDPALEPGEGAESRPVETPAENQFVECGESPVSESPAEDAFVPADRPGEEPAEAVVAPVGAEEADRGNDSPWGSG